MKNLMLHLNGDTVCSRLRDVMTTDSRCSKYSLAGILSIINLEMIK